MDHGSTLTESEAARILSELAERYGSAPYDPTQDITVKDVVRRLHVTEAQARRYLADEVAAGRLVKRHVNLDGPQTNVYRRK